MAEYKVTFPENKKVDVSFKSFELKTDQTKKNDGDETAPEPFDLFLSSLATCAGIYAKTFCDSRKISADNMSLTLIPYFKKGQKLMDKIEMTLYVDQDFPEKYIKAIIKSMNGCAVKNQLHPDLDFQTGVSYL